MTPSSPKVGWRGAAAALLCAGLAGAPSTAWALDGNDELLLTLKGGDLAAGWYVGVDRDTIRLSGDNRFTDVPLDLVVEVVRDGQPLPLEEFLAEAADAQAALDLLRAEPPVHPPPAVPFAASMAYAGAGHAALGEWKGAAAFAAADTIILGAAAWQLFGEESIPGAIPVLVLDLIIKGAAAGDAARIAKRRRRQLEGPLGPPP